MAHRYVLQEPRIPFEPEIIYEDSHIIVIDKPHFLPTTPRGMWYRSTALTYMRDLLHNNDLVPAHRLDRMTAGIVVLVKARPDRRVYQMLFQDRYVHKMYECVALAPRYSAQQMQPRFPIEVKSYIQKDVGTMQAYEKDLPSNSHTRIELKDRRSYTENDIQMIKKYPQYRIYQLFPFTGKTHQLRVHMNSLGLPIMNDPLYPCVRFGEGEENYEDFSCPLQLIARSLEFTDPISGKDKKFFSKMQWNVE